MRADAYRQLRQRRNWRLSPSSLGTNITTLEIKGAATTRSGGIRLSTSDDSQKAAFYVYDGAGIVGTETAHPFGIYTSNTERLRIDSSGNVGIGTTSADANLHIKGGYPTVHIERDSDINYSRLLLDNTANDGGAIDGLGDGVGDYVSLRLMLEILPSGRVSTALEMSASAPRRLAVNLLFLMEALQELSLDHLMVTSLLTIAPH